MTLTDAVVEYVLDDTEITEFHALADELSAVAEHPAGPDFYDRHWPMVERLPVGLRRFLEDFRRSEPAAAALVRGFPVDDARIGPTPGHWDAARGVTATRDQEAFLALSAMVLGEPFTWATLQGGRLIHDVLPIPGNESRQNGHGSETLLEFHTEDGFHPRRCDYLLLFGLRNHDRVPTLVSSVRDVTLGAEERAVLSEPRFHVLPDDEHVLQLRASNPDHPALRMVERMRREPEPVAVLFGDGRNPYVRIDRPFMRCVGDDPVAEHALDALMTALEKVQHDVVVDRGTLLIVDNYLAVHGRRPFGASYDGTDRWLKKSTVSRNLRRWAGWQTDNWRTIL